ncbi:MAG: carboxypeptidase regulatory-like domain-containing protein [Flavobacteriales bacterium]|nr:carboxypeptidase regulatory-like domain-containing protein [Flavobacteriales bacterium]
MHAIRTSLAIIALTTLPGLAYAQENAAKSKAGATAEPVLPITGRITDGDKKLEGCHIAVYRENDLVGEQTTDKTGKFKVGLPVGETYGIVFQREGFVPKRILVDTRAELPKGELVFEPLDMEVSMLASSKYDGTDTDALDFPFAIVSWDKRVKAFTQDEKYTRDMMRTNGALLLMAGRSTRQ